jgi:hypothetical protein
MEVKTTLLPRTQIIWTVQVQPVVVVLGVLVLGWCW